MTAVLAFALAALFAVAALAKLRDIAGAAEAVRDFGVPAPAARPVACSTVCLEVAVAALVCAPVTRRIGAAGAIALLVVFTGAISAAWARGERADCHCFGQLHSAPAGPRAIVRNLALIAVAVLVALGEPPAPALDAEGWAIVALFCLCALGAGFGWQLLLQHGRLLTRIDELEERLDGRAPRAQQRAGTLPVGAAATEVAVGEGPLAELLDGGRPLLLTFVAPGCGPCRTLLPAVGEWQRAYGERVRFEVLRRGGPDYDGDGREAFGLERATIDGADAAFDAFGVSATPTAVLLDGEGRVAAPYALGRGAVEDLAAVALERAPDRPAVTVERAPDGRDVQLIVRES
ncbi:MAG: MauE/DoxX family redox-associated membrane protein [Solirubrobacteraceae bacterium]